MDQFRRMAILVSVVENGSIRGAAREMEITPSAVSQQLSRLEREAGVTLLTRTTRRLALTEAGEAFYEGCAAMVAAARGAHERLAALHDAPMGELGISAPPGFAATHLGPALAPLLAAHPTLRLRIAVAEVIPDMIRERIDLAVTIGRAVPSSRLLRHHLADWALGICAAPDYVARRGMPAAPAGLARHDFVALPRWHHGSDVLTSASGRRVRVSMKSRVTADNQHTVRQLTLAGAGLSFQALPEVAEELRSGRLVRVLPSWTAPVLSVDALMPRRAAQPAKVRLAIEALKSHLAGSQPGAPRKPGRAEAPARKGRVD
jgi:DNA-binding transcriptional LysR family regulator